MGQCVGQCAVFSCVYPTTANPVPVAGIGLDSDCNLHQAYDHSYPDHPGAFALDPLHLHFGQDRHVLPRHPDGSFGTLFDAGPDAWGFKLTQRICRVTGATVPTTTIDWFVHSGPFGSG